MCSPPNHTAQVGVWRGLIYVISLMGVTMTIDKSPIKILHVVVEIQK